MTTPNVGTPDREKLIEALEGIAEHGPTCDAECAPQMLALGREALPLARSLIADLTRKTEALKETRAVLWNMDTTPLGANNYAAWDHALGIIRRALAPNPTKEGEPG